MSSNLRRLAIACLLPLITTACTTSQTAAPSSTLAQSRDGESTGEKLDVVATVLPTYLFTKAVAGDAANVTILVKPGTEVHEYQSTPQDVQAIAQADVVVENGLGLEAFLDSTIENAQNLSLKVIDASEGITPIGEMGDVVHPTEHGDDQDEAEHAAELDEQTDASSNAHAGEDSHTHAENPHVWLDPVLAIQQVETIRDGLIVADPSHKATYEGNAAAYIEALQKLDRQFRETLQPFGDRTFITFHDAFPYLAKRYKLEQVAIVTIPEDSIAPGDIQKTIGAVKQFKVKALFSEPGVDNKLLTSLSADLGLQLRTLDSLESGDLDPQYYFTVMETNLKTLEDTFR
jgi:zinc/manganese transport system substrate-binding protein